MREGNTSIEVHRPERYIHIRLKGIVQPEEVVRRLGDCYAALTDPWQYDQLYDIAGLINVFNHKDFLAISHMWRGIAANYRQLRIAIVTTDPFRLDRTRAFAPLFDNLEAHAFPTIGQAVDWLTGDAFDSAPAAASTGS